MKNSTSFLLLILLQALHSIEETTFGLYNLLPYFRPFGDAAFEAFAIGNTLVVTLGLWCYLYRVKPGAASARAWMWGWCIVEIGNGIGHPTWSLLAGQYIPGTVTAPFLLATGAYLVWQLTARPTAYGA